eukprot:1181263-Prorocentrum_minimum.AAC.2
MPLSSRQRGMLSRGGRGWAGAANPIDATEEGDALSGGGLVGGSGEGLQEQRWRWARWAIPLMAVLLLWTAVAGTVVKIPHPKSAGAARTQGAIELSEVTKRWIFYRRSRARRAAYYQYFVRSAFKGEEPFASIVDANASPPQSPVATPAATSPAKVTEPSSPSPSQRVATSHLSPMLCSVFLNPLHSRWAPIFGNLPDIPPPGQIQVGAPFSKRARNEAWLANRLVS